MGTPSAQESPSHWNDDQEAALQQALRGTGPGLSDSATDAEVMAYQMRQAGFDGPMTPVDFKVEIAGAGWVRDFQLDDGTVVLKSAMDADDLRRKIADLPLDGSLPDVPGYLVHATEAFERLSVRDANYMPAPVSVDSMALQDDFRRFEIEQMNAAGAHAFQAVNDRRLAAGSYDRFSEIGSAWSAGRYGDVWRHMTYEASEPARAAAFFPQPHPTVARLDQMIASPIGAGVSGIARSGSALRGLSGGREDRQRAGVHQPGVHRLDAAAPSSRVTYRPLMP